MEQQMPLDEEIAKGYKSLLEHLSAADFAKPKLYRLDDPPYLPEFPGPTDKNN